MNALLKIAVGTLVVIAGLWCLTEVMNSGAEENLAESDLQWQYGGTDTEAPVPDQEVNLLEPHSVTLVSNSSADEDWTDLASPAKSDTTTGSSFNGQTFVSTKQGDESFQDLDGFNVEGSSGSSQTEDDSLLTLDGGFAESKPMPAKPVGRNMTRSLPLVARSSSAQSPAAPSAKGGFAPLPKIRSLPNQGDQTATGSVRSLPSQSQIASQPPTPSAQFVKNPHFANKSLAKASTNQNESMPSPTSLDLPLSDSKSEQLTADGSMNETASNDDPLNVDDLLAVEPEDLSKQAQVASVPKAGSFKPPTARSGGSTPVANSTTTASKPVRFGSFGGQSPKPQIASSRPVRSSGFAASRPAPTQAPAARPVPPKAEIAVSARQRNIVSSPVVEERARERIAYGKSLARRGSTYSARQEFTHALRMLAEAHDITAQTRQYTSHLSSGLRALEEAGDFVTDDTRQQLAMSVSTIVEAHSTQLLDSYEATRTSPMEAMQVYYDFAARELASAVGTSSVGADALQCLGKLLTTSTSDRSAMDQTKAMVMHQAAMLTNPSNPETCNELGVLMARNGRLEKASELFKQSLIIKKTPQAWQNLGKVHERLAQMASNPKARQEQQRLSQLAYSESELLAQKMPTAQFNGPMEWVNGEVFESAAAIAPVQGDPKLRVAKAPETLPAEKPKAKGIFRNVKKLF